MVNECCTGIHDWRVVPGAGSHNLKPVFCRDYVAVLEHMLVETTGDPDVLDLAHEHLMAGTTWPAPVIPGQGVLFEVKDE